MRQILLITISLLCALSCEHYPKKQTPKTLNQLQHEFVDVMLDSTATWKQVTAVVYPLVDSLCVANADECSLKNRMFGQEWGYMAIELMNEKYKKWKMPAKRSIMTM